jgi:hypothetical protein
MKVGVKCLNLEGSTLDSNLNLRMVDEAVGSFVMF